MIEFAFRFFVGGVVVSAFAVLGDLFMPKSFAGLFAAAPSVALAMLGLTIPMQGAGYASLEARSMILGAVALFVYSQVTAWCLMRLDSSSLVVASSAILLWLGVAFSLFSAL